MNDIVSRIRHFLTQMGIANSTFADVCGIPRPSLSQLLNGRNRKVSNEVIDKIHQAYPQINMMWLMFGDGDMLVPNANTPDSDTALSDAQNSVSGSAAEAQMPVGFGDGQAHDLGQRKAASVSTNPLTDALAAVARGAGQRKGAQATERRIASVIIVFSDGDTQVVVP